MILEENLELGIKAVRLSREGKIIIKGDNVE